MKHISYNKYLKFKEDLNKSYSQKFSAIRKGSVAFSLFGNAASIFFAYFFFVSIFSTTMYNINPLVLGIGVVGFLTLFEFVKRYVFDIFSINVIKLKSKFFKSSKISFLFATLILIAFSFMFSLNGAQKLVNKEKQNIEITQNNIQEQVDSVNTYYLETYINAKSEENKSLIDQRQKDLDYLDNGFWKSNTERNNVNERITNVDKRIGVNDSIIAYYNAEKNKIIDEIKQSENSTLLSDQLQNEINIIYFLLLSAIIEIIIMVGIYYNRKYENVVIKEYEDEIVNTAQFKKWKLSNSILETIFNYGDIRVDEPLPSIKSITEVIEANEMPITKKELDDTLKIFKFLKISETRGSRRYLKMDINEAKFTLNNYFKIK